MLPWKENNFPLIRAGKRFPANASPLTWGGNGWMQKSDFCTMLLYKCEPQLIGLGPRVYWLGCGFKYLCMLTPKLGGYLFNQLDLGEYFSDGWFLEDELTILSFWSLPFFSGATLSVLGRVPLPYPSHPFSDSSEKITNISLYPLKIQSLESMKFSFWNVSFPLLGDEEIRSFSGGGWTRSLTDEFFGLHLLTNKKKYKKVIWVSKKPYVSTLRIIGPYYRGVWLCIAGFWDLQIPSFEIPWFLG